MARRKNCARVRSRANMRDASFDGPSMPRRGSEVGSETPMGVLSWDTQRFANLLPTRTFAASAVDKALFVGPQTRPYTVTKVEELQRVVLGPSVDERFRVGA